MLSPKPLDDNQDEIKTLNQLDKTLKIARKLIARLDNNSEKKPVLYLELVNRVAQLRNAIVKNKEVDLNKDPKKYYKLSPETRIEFYQKLDKTLKQMANPTISDLDEIQNLLAIMPGDRSNKILPRTHWLRRHWGKVVFAVAVISLLGVGILSGGLGPVIIGAVGVFLSYSIPGILIFPPMTVKFIAVNIAFGLAFEKAVEIGWKALQNWRCENALVHLEKTIDEWPAAQPDNLDHATIESLTSELKDLAREVIDTVRVSKGMDGASNFLLTAGLKKIQYALDACKSGDKQQITAAVLELDKFDTPIDFLSRLFKEHKNSLLIGSTVLALATVVATAGLSSLSFGRQAVIKLFTCALPVLNQSLVQQAQGLAIGVVVGRVRDAKLEVDKSFEREEVKQLRTKQKTLLASSDVVEKFKERFKKLQDNVADPPVKKNEEDDQSEGNALK